MIINIIFLLLLKIIPLILATSSKSAKICRACEDLSSEVQSKLVETEKKAKDEIKVGGRIGPDGEPIRNKVIQYGNSYIILLFAICFF